MRLKDFKGSTFYVLSPFADYKYISVFIDSNNDGNYRLASKIDTHTDTTITDVKSYYYKNNEYLIINNFYENGTSVYDNLEQAKADVLKHSLKYYQEKLTKTEKQLTKIKEILSNLEKTKEKYLQIFPEKLI